MPALTASPVPLGASSPGLAPQPHLAPDLHALVPSPYMHLLSPLPLLLSGAAITLFVLLWLSLQKSPTPPPPHQSQPALPSLSAMEKPTAERAAPQPPYQDREINPDLEDDDEQPLSATPFDWGTQAEDNAPYLDLWDSPATPPDAEYSWENLAADRDPMPVRRLEHFAVRGTEGRPMPNPTVEMREGPDAAVALVVPEARRRSYTKVTQTGMEVKGEVVVAEEGWRRHTRVYGGGVCLACLESERRARARV